MSQPYPVSDAWDRIVADGERRRARKRKEWQDPVIRAAKAAYYRSWVAAHREQRRAYNREWMRRYRKAGPKDGRIGALHNLGCDGDHWQKRRGCKPIPVFDHPVTAQ